MLTYSKDQGVDVRMRQVLKVRKLKARAHELRFLDSVDHPKYRITMISLDLSANSPVLPKTYTAVGIGVSKRAEADLLKDVQDL